MRSLQEVEEELEQVSIAYAMSLVEPLILELKEQVALSNLETIKAARRNAQNKSNNLHSTLNKLVTEIAIIEDNNEQ